LSLGKVKVASSTLAWGFELTNDAAFIYSKSKSFQHLLTKDIPSAKTICGDAGESFISINFSSSIKYTHAPKSNIYIQTKTYFIIV